MENESSIVQDVKLLENLPSDWNIEDFNNLVADNSGGNKKIPKKDFLEVGSIAIVDQGKKMIAGYSNNNDLKVRTKQPYIVFGDHTRIFKYIDFSFIMGADGTKVLQPKSEKCFTKFLYYFFLSINIPNTGYNRHFKYLKSLKIPLPPLATQKKIAQKLDTADSLRQKNKAIIQKYTDLTQALFLEMFGDPVSNPKGWELEKFGNNITLIGGGTPSKEIEEYWNGNIYWASVKDFKSNTLTKTVDKITQLGVEKSATRIISKGTILIATRMAVGKVLIPEIDVAINQDLKALYENEKYKKLFLLYLLKSKKQYFEKISTGATVKGIKINHITDLKMPIPPISLQNEFAERVKAIESQKALAEKALEQSENLFNALLQASFIPS